MKLYFHTQKEENIPYWGSNYRLEYRLMEKCEKVSVTALLPFDLNFQNSNSKTLSLRFCVLYDLDQTLNTISRKNTIFEK